jgi:CHAT domain-containing protein
MDYIDARRKAESSRVEMRKHPLLARVLEFREGTFQVDFSLNATIPEALVKPIKFVDWFIPQVVGSKQKGIVLLVRHSDGSTSSRTLDITAQTVEKWIRRVLDFPREAEAPLRIEGAAARLRELDKVVRGLEELTQEDDLLILSPSGLLNRIPIHALRVAGQPLFERNPFIYSSSAAVFRHCLMRATHKVSSNAVDTHDAAREHKAALLAVYDEPTETGAVECVEIYIHATKLAVDFPYKIHTGSDVTKTSFQSAGCNAQWVHYHGHAVFNETDVLQSGLVLAEGAHRDNPETDTDKQSGILTVAEIFGIDMLDNAPHFTIIACDSGTQKVAPGDEPLGLIPALLYAGAASVIGTLWPVDSATGRRFSEFFHHELKLQLDSHHRQQEEGGKKPRRIFLDLASALRNTVRKLRRPVDGLGVVDTRQPLHWAPWILHGCWYHIVQ